MCALVLALLTGACASLSVGGSRYLARGGPDLSALTVSHEVELLGPFHYELHGLLRQGAAGREGALLGAGADLTVLSGQSRLPYLIGGLDLGVGTRDHPTTWSSWSAGLGGQAAALGPLGLRIEGRYRRMTAENRRGLEVGIRIGRAWRSARPVSSSRAPRSLATALPALDAERAGGGAAGSLRVSVVETAIQAMGTPYRWGGSDVNGFDCSGLIHFAYGQHGLALPRRSAEQAQSGTPVSRNPAELLPGDILTFATAGGGTVSHVGLYIGEGRFIHSATGGVQLSRLSPQDPYGRWWWDRWVGVRRVAP